MVGRWLTKSIRSERFFSICCGGSRLIKSSAQSSCWSWLAWEGGRRERGRWERREDGRKAGKEGREGRGREGRDRGREGGEEEGERGKQGGREKERETIGREEGGICM